MQDIQIEEAKDQPQAVLRGPMKLRLFRILFVLVGLIVGFCLAEIVVRVLQPHRVRTPTAIDDPHLLYRNEPGISGRHTSPGEFAYRFSINSHGFRGREVETEKAKDQVRILCVGDSFTWGSGVNDDETFPAVLEATLAAEEQPGGYEVINAGVMSWGISQYYVWTRREGLTFDADVLLVALYEDDWENALVGLVTEAEDGTLAEHELAFTQLKRQRAVAKWVPGFRWFMSTSQLLNLVRDSLRASVTWPPGTSQFVTPDPEDEQETARKALRMTNRMLGTLDQECRAEECAFAVVWISCGPCVADALEGKLPDDHLGQKAYRVKGSVRQFCAEQDIPFLDTAEAFAHYCRAHAVSPEYLYFPRDGHCRPAGYGLLGRTVASFLMEKVLDCPTQ